MPSHTRYTAAARRRLEAERAAARDAEDRAHAGMTLEQYLEAAAEFDLAAQVDPAGFVEFQTARHAELVARCAA